MQPGDLVFFWMAGDPEIRGIYGWGTLTSRAYNKPNWDSHGVDVLCQHCFSRPILATRLRTDKLLADMLVLRAPQGTNFLLSQEESARLASFISRAGEPVPNLT
jgi:hypothetical protein